MQRIGELIRELRIENKYPLRKVAAVLDIDQAILSKMERGLRRFRKEQVLKLAGFFNYDEKELLLVFLSDRILYEIREEENALEALKIAESVLEYKKWATLDRDRITEKIVDEMKKYPKIINAWIFGSFARKEDGPGSDIDIAVQTDKGFNYFDLAGLQHSLEEKLSRKVDVGFIHTLKPRILQNVKQDLILIYERQKP